MSSFWHWMIVVLTLLNVAACWWLIWWSAKQKAGEFEDGVTMDHVWDGDLRERNNPLPKWWLGLFQITIVFGLIYMFLYPSLGDFQGVLGWSQLSRYQEEVQQADARYSSIYAAFEGRGIEDLSRDPAAIDVGRSLYANNCSTCHGSDARGAVGFPNLADGDWLYGGSSDAILHSIVNGRQGMMPALGAAIDDQGIAEIIAYIRTLGGDGEMNAAAQAGQARFALCAACHGMDGTGNQMLGAPKLSDDIWLYGGSDAAIGNAIRHGLNGIMPPWGGILGEEKSKLLAAYVMQLGGE